MSTTLPPLPQNTVFADYHREFAALLQGTTEKIAAAQSQPAESAAAHLDEADLQLQEAASLLKSMEMESQTQDQSTRNALRPHISVSRDAVSSARANLRAARIAAAQRRDDANRIDLLGDDRDRLRMADTTRDLERGSELILDSRRHIAETETVGAGILEDLQAQRNTIQRARQNLGNVDTGLDQSSSILSTMHRRAIVNKIVIYFILIAIGIACLGIIYARVFHPRSRQ